MCSGNTPYNIVQFSSGPFYFHITYLASPVAVGTFLLLEEVLPKLMQFERNE